MNSKNWRAMFYIFREILPGFLVGLVVFISILLMFQVLRLTEFILLHGGAIEVVAELVTYMSVSFLPAILPMSVIFSVIMTYGRLSTDSEVIAMKSLGIDMWSLTGPAAILGVIVALLSALSSFYIGPWGNRKFEILMSQLGSQKVTAAIREGAFAEGFYDLVVYANKVNEQEGILNNVFIYDERKGNMPVTIISKKGIVLKSKNNFSSTLRLIDGSIHRTADELYTKINFKTYDIFLSNPNQIQIKEKSPPSMTLSELRGALNKTEEPKTEIKLLAELHKRWSITFACFVFAIFGVGLGIVTQRRTQKSGGFVISIGLIVVYWILHISMESAARNGFLTPGIALWIPSILFFGASIYSLRKIWHT